MIANPTLDKKIYQLARDYLHLQNIPGVTADVVEKYLKPVSVYSQPSSMADIYYRILESAQNANMKAGVIGKAIGGVNKLAVVLENFDAKAVLSKYGNKWETVLDEIIKQLRPRGEIRRTQRSIWPHYCQTILSAARFVEQFQSADDFFNWVNFFDRDDRARASLPMLLSREIDGFGFALSCDFLKELGYVNFPKPDVHLRDIFTSLDLCPAKGDDYQLFKAIVRLAGNANVSPYNADKVFWLIGSGFFYADVHIGTNGKIGSRKKSFIDYAKNQLSKAIKENPNE